ncbi:Flp pilus assembly protein CpaB [Rhodovulum sp. YNF3179]|uniref:Flp pilus assembly protein CpaB n=1 Tax=Rhodovulum sp. YNF3179 TaxID=3425127 RepID=UPI003D334A4F
MRSTNILSFAVALFLAAVAVYGARNWLNEQRQELVASTRQTVEQPQEAPSRMVVVASEPLRFGERVTRESLALIEWRADVAPRGAFETIEEVIASEEEDDARYVLSAMQEGELVLAANVTNPGERAKLSTMLSPGMKAIAISVNNVAGFVLPGDRVDVMLTRGDFVDLLLQGVKVLAIDQIADETRDDPTPSRTVTFEVTTQEAQKLVLAQRVGSLSLALRKTGSADVDEPNRVSAADLGEPTVSEEMLRAAQGEQDEIRQEELERLTNLERLIESWGEGLTLRLDQLEEGADEGPATARDLMDSKSTVGVIRGGQRSEYSVNKPDAGPSQ